MSKRPDVSLVIATITARYRHNATPKPEPANVARVSAVKNATNAVMVLPN
jgi:hypothetical protein